MHKPELRSDKTCLNCGHPVELRYCSQCGQENTETRRSFGHLLIHFIEDLTHYEGKFWNTIRKLLSRPGFLTTVYLEGKRMTYLTPVRLYIFISFVTFLLPHLIPNPKEPAASGLTATEQAELDAIIYDTSQSVHYHSRFGLILPRKFTGLQALDSARSTRIATGNPMTTSEYLIHKKTIELERYTPRVLWELFLKSISNNFPKALFLYMPLFALVIRVFHPNKRWMYFDHAIYTLHYFSFLLLGFSLWILLSDALAWTQYCLSLLNDWTNC